MRRREESFEFGGQVVTVWELTVDDIRAWLHSVEQIAADVGDRPDVVSLLLFEDCTFDDLKRMSTVTDQQLGAEPPSEIEKLKAKCRELNCHFFGLRSRLMSLGRQMAASPT